MKSAQVSTTISPRAGGSGPSGVQTFVRTSDGRIVAMSQGGMITKASNEAQVTLLR